MALLYFPAYFQGVALPGLRKLCTPPPHPNMCHSVSLLAKLFHLFERIVFVFLLLLARDLDRSTDHVHSVHSVSN
jgi:hypothetical protein